VRTSGNTSRKPSPKTPASPQPSPQGNAFDADSWVDRLLRPVLPVTCWIDPGEEGEAFRVAVEFSGRRIGPTGRRRAGDRFSQVETVERILPGSGPLSVTTVVKDVSAGTWSVSSRPVIQGRRSARLPAPEGSASSRSRRLGWPWTYRAMSASTNETAETALAPFAAAPGVIPAAYSILVAAGIVVGLAVVAILASRLGEPVGTTMTVSAVAVVTGVAGAKVWYVAGHRGRRLNGWCIQGFIFGAAGAGLVLGSVWLAVPVGEYLDTVAAGLLVGMGIGRVGCFFAGCCRGRLTASRWGVWSSDQRVGARRIPVQLLESALALTMGILAFVAASQRVWGVPGAVFVAAIATYTLGRQFLLPLRADPRHFRFGRWAVVLLGVLALVADAIWVIGAS
jgi:phosphatidylglycerol---prolipoprotein diacylglyceryl transferase